jgi:RNA polymerase-binding transcription factor DksA
MLSTSWIIACEKSGVGPYPRIAIHGLKQALERLRQGTFGECAECGGEIEPKRLEAIPWARYCVKCQEAREQSRGHST